MPSNSGSVEDTPNAAIYCYPNAYLKDREHSLLGEGICTQSVHSFCVITKGPSVQAGLQDYV